MPRLAIVTDSTAYIPENLARQYDIYVAPQVLIWDDKTYADGVDIKPTEFYTRLKTSRSMPTTSQASPATMKGIFEPLAAQGRPVLGIFISGELSRTLSSAELARDLLGGADITLMDSRTTAMALGFQVLAAARAAEAGKPLPEVIAAAEQARERTGVIFVVDTLEFLHRGGRIGAAQRFLGTALNMKPLLEVRGGRVEPIERVRTAGKAIARLLDLIQERTGGQRPLRLATIHAAAEEQARQLLATAQERFSPDEALLSEASPVVGTHAGPGTLGLAYCAGV